MIYVSTETYNDLTEAKDMLTAIKRELEENILRKEKNLAMVKAELFAIDKTLMLASYEPFVGDSPCVPPIGGDL